MRWPRLPAAPCPTLRPTLYYYYITVGRADLRYRSRVRSRSSWRPRLRREMVDERWSTDTQLPDPETLKRGSPSGARLDHAPWTWKANSPTRAAFAGALACAGDAQGINKQGTINAGRRIRCCLLKLRSRAGACSPMSDRCCSCAMLLLAATRHASATVVVMEQWPPRRGHRASVPRGPYLCAAD